MEEREIVERAKGGDRAAFASLVARYRRRAYGYFMARLGREEEVEDLCQEAFLRAFIHLRGLRDGGRFGPWLFAICRNCLRSRAGAMAAEGRLIRPLAEDSPAEDYAAWESMQSLARACLGLLDEETRTLVCLRHESGLSYAQVSRATGLSEALVKSRLFRARERLRAIRADVEAGILIEPERDAKIKEGIMKDVETMEKGAWILERLSLALQRELARAAEANQAFGEGLIAQIAALGGGKEYLAGIGARLDLREFCDIISCADGFTERRLVESLEESDPELAGKIKRSTFVLQDLSLFDAGALSALMKAVDASELALSLSGIERAIRDGILSAMELADADTLRREMAEASGGSAAFEEARSAVLRAVRALFASGEISLRTQGGGMAVVAS